MKNLERLLNLYLAKKLEKISHLIAKKSLLPASIFTKKQIEKIDQNFRRFWEQKTVSSYYTPAKKPRFSTFTLGTPHSLWEYHFDSDEKQTELLSEFSLHHFETQTKDKIRLNGTLFRRKKKHLAPSRTLILFGGNGELYKIGSAAWVFKLVLKANADFDIVMFDPRECGESSGVAFASGLIEDGLSIFRFVNETLGVDQDLIDLCGFSLGGAIATLVKEHYKETKGALISNRSFQSLEKAIEHIFTPLGQTLSFFISHAAKNLASKTNWHLDPLSAWSKIEGPKMVISHEKDPIVRYKASLQIGILEENLTKNSDLIVLKQKDPSHRIFNHHVQPLSFYNDQDGNDVEEMILNFLNKIHFQSIKTA
jgi:esterase/lipase